MARPAAANASPRRWRPRRAEAGETLDADEALELANEGTARDARDSGAPSVHSATRASCWPPRRCRTRSNAAGGARRRWRALQPAVPAVASTRPHPRARHQRARRKACGARDHGDRGRAGYRQRAVRPRQPRAACRRQRDRDRSDRCGALSDARAPARRGELDALARDDGVGFLGASDRGLPTSARGG